MILLIDNYDSFTWNLVHLIGGLGYTVEVKRNDALSVSEALDYGAEAIVLSPGPCTPDQAGICVDLVRAAAKSATPMFGVCLGLQSMAQALGGKVTPADRLMHGKVSRITHQGGFMTGMPDSFTATRYHSLVAEAASLPDCYDVIATSDDDDLIMALQHKQAPIAAVQFHPESIASEAGADMFQGFMNWAQQKTAEMPSQ